MPKMNVIIFFLMITLWTKTYKHVSRESWQKNKSSQLHQIVTCYEPAMCLQYIRWNGPILNIHDMALFSALWFLCGGRTSHKTMTN